MWSSPKCAHEILIHVLLSVGSRPITKKGPFVTMNRPFRLLVLVLGLAAVVFAADTSEWPQFRGPQCNPVSHGRLPDTWSKTENVEWSVEIPGRGWSSPIVSGGKVFLTTAITEGKSKQPQIGTEYSNEYV